jgi:hypothetical protein
MESQTIIIIVLVIVSCIVTVVVNWWLCKRRRAAANQPVPPIPAHPAPAIGMHSNPIHASFSACQQADQGAPQSIYYASSAVLPASRPPSQSESNPPQSMYYAVSSQHGPTAPQQARDATLAYSYANDPPKLRAMPAVYDAPSGPPPGGATMYAVPPQQQAGEYHGTGVGQPVFIRETASAVNVSANRLSWASSADPGSVQAPQPQSRQSQQPLATRTPSASSSYLDSEVKGILGDTRQPVSTRMAWTSNEDTNDQSTDTDAPGFPEDISYVQPDQFGDDSYVPMH